MSITGPAHGTTRTQVAIIGGGIMGAASAYHLARAGITDVVLLEADKLASGSSGKPLGGVRAQFSDVTNIELGLRSLEFFRRFDHEVGVDIGLQTVGYLFALRNEEDIARHRVCVALQNSLGVPSRIVDPAEALRLCPYLDPQTVLAGVWSPSDGFARAGDAVRGLAGAAQARGVQVRTGSAVTGIDAAPGGMARIHLADGADVLTPTVVCAAGAWSRTVGEMVGVDLPVTPKRREIAFTPALSPRPPQVPFTIDYSTTAYFHGSQDGGLLLGWADPDQPDGFEREVSRAWHDHLRAALRAFAPDLAGVPISHGWAGLYELTPDCNALIGQSEEPGFRFLYATGFSGHGFLQGPAVGECVRDLYLGRPPVVDIAPFDAHRFQRPAVRTELGII
ncbi:NAD(P)/FAD-dependent oxidoreductase [Pseudonocardia charpentierae]|uniref:FAD-dependent oxidoreductase n=1 Tax=Pseudonocardia charpentierae TaxID=3075545 RepID=A0ABU2NGJ7_9PSEU|nr:FAD-dependent oxidoreductase [Pseudonocardia sp. DSM 45834]MDT0353085.1 FAD-dependent oxidoreductase [Pseudonocardia sp. DSM 45834]